MLEIGRGNDDGIEIFHGQQIFHVWKGGGARPYSSAAAFAARSRFHSRNRRRQSSRRCGWLSVRRRRASLAAAIADTDMA